MGKSVYAKFGRRSQAVQAPRTHAVKGGETLMSIAAFEYPGTNYDSELWRQVAEANEITDPDSIYPGQVLRIPDPSPRDTDQLLVSDDVRKVGTPGAISAAPLGTELQGQGISYPMAYDATGRLTVSSGDALVQQAILSIALTVKNERTGNPDYGGDGMTFEPSDPVLGLTLKTAILESEGRIEPSSLDIQVSDENSDRPTVTVRYRLAGDTTPRNFTFPFFQLNRPDQGNT